MNSSYLLAVATSDYLPSNHLEYRTFRKFEILQIRSRGPPDGWSVVRFTII